MGKLAEAAFSDASLREAWEDVLDADRQDGLASPGITRFAEKLDENLGRLVADLAWDTYRPADVTTVLIPKSEGMRTLGVPPARDRVVARALLKVLTPIIDPLLGPAAYAYRPGLGVTDAVQTVARLRDEGLGWVLRTDVDDCFPTIPLAHLRRLLEAVIDDAEALAVVTALLGRCAIDRKGRRRLLRGLPQGCALSPLFANLVLAQVDATVLEAGFALVRYADDMVIATDSRDDAWEAARYLAKAVGDLGMSPGTRRHRRHVL